MLLGQIQIRQLLLKAVPPSRLPAVRFFSAQPISGSLGALIPDVDLTQPSESQTKEIRQALLNHQVIFFRNQSLTPQQFLTFATALGKPIEYPFVRGIEGYPTIINVLKREHEIKNFGGVWHSDTTYFPSPPMASLLYCLETPLAGGDTLFANQYLAFESLSPALQTMLSTLRGVSCSANPAASTTREDRVKDPNTAAEKKGAAEIYEAVHPVVRTHPETGRKGLFVNVAHTTRFEGWTEEESAPLLEYLFRHQTKEEFTCRFRWGVGSLAVWDNRCTLHYPINDYHGQRRSLWRITLEGDVPK